MLITLVLEGPRLLVAHHSFHQQREKQGRKRTHTLDENDNGFGGFAILAARVPNKPHKICCSKALAMLQYCCEVLEDAIDDPVVGVAYTQEAVLNFEEETTFHQTVPQSHDEPVLVLATCVVCKGV
jgi:hypothetical protein